MLKYFSIYIFIAGTSSFAMQQEQRTASEIINECLVKHAELYEFPEEAKKFWGDLGRQCRFEALTRRKIGIIKEEIINPVDKALEELKNEKSFSLESIFYITANPNLQAIGNLFSNKEYQKIIIKLTLLKEEIKKGLKNDPYKSDEKKVICYAELTPDLMKHLSRVLFDLRSKQGKEAQVARQQIEHCVSLPRKIKSCPPKVSDDNFGGPEGGMAKFLDEIFTNSKLKIYSENTKLGLRNVITEICRQSQLGSRGALQHMKKLAFLFYGESGIGKSFVAEEIATLLKLPVIEIEAITQEDLGHGKITGNSDYGTAHLGKIFEAFYQKDPNGETWLNVVVIINEIDRMMGKYNNMLKPLMDLWDNNIRQIMSNYLGQKVFSVGIIWICTANSDFGKGDSTNVISTGFSNNKDPFKALRDRMTFLYFEAIPENGVLILVDNFIKDKRLFDLSICYEPSQADAMGVKLSSFIAKNFRGLSIRVIESAARRLSNLPEREWWKESSELKESVAEYEEAQAELTQRRKFNLGTLEAVKEQAQLFPGNPKLQRDIEKLLSELEIIEEKLKELEENIAEILNK